MNVPLFLGDANITVSVIIFHKETKLGDLLLQITQPRYLNRLYLGKVRFQRIFFWLKMVILKIRNPYKWRTINLKLTYEQVGTSGTNKKMKQIEEYMWLKTIVIQFFEMN